MKKEIFSAYFRLPVIAQVIVHLLTSFATVFQCWLELYAGGISCGISTSSGALPASWCTTTLPAVGPRGDSLLSRSLHCTRPKL
ncbi:hypothetical protein EDD17DRAFT_1534936 [Pisolithus thermaeus]|nr:hypothetical protein EDD17DRAFT_1534936 [Pisolithus thermaeus]